MTITLDKMIEKINSLDEPDKRKEPLPSSELIEKYEEKIGIVFSDDYKTFLKSISNAFVGYISPFTLNENSMDEYGDLHCGFIEGRKIGVPENWLPICEDNGDYYCILPDGKIRFWDHQGASEEYWPDLATWVNDVWLEDG